MPLAAPRIDSRVVAALALLDNRSVPIAEINRRVGGIALSLGLTKPSYEQVRVLVHALRRRRGGAATGIIVLGVTNAGPRPSLLARLLRRLRRRRRVAQVTVCYLLGARVITRGTRARSRSPARAAR